MITDTLAPSGPAKARWLSGVQAATIVFAIGAAACGSSEEGVATDAAVVVEVDAAAPDTWTSFASEFFDTYCGECHGAGDTLRDYTLLPTVQTEQAKILCGVSPDTVSGCTISARQFPIGSGPKPSDEERARLVDWINDGAPN